MDHVDGRFLRIVSVGHPLDYGLREERADRFLDAHRRSTLPAWEIITVSPRLDVVEPVTETIVHGPFRLFLAGHVLVLVRVVGEVEQNYRRQNRHFIGRRTGERWWLRGWSTRIRARPRPRRRQRSKASRTRWAESSREQLREESESDGARVRELV